MMTGHSVQDIPDTLSGHRPDRHPLSLEGCPVRWLRGQVSGASSNGRGTGPHQSRPPGTGARRHPWACEAAPGRQVRRGGADAAAVDACRARGAFLPANAWAKQHGGSARVPASDLRKASVDRADLTTHTLVCIVRLFNVT
jgi:hypothetical protein